MNRVLVTCPPMIGMLDDFRKYASDKGLELVAADTQQILSEDQLLQMVPEYEGWVIGDDPATRRVLEAGTQGGLRAAVKWGVGVDNVDFAGAESVGLHIPNTPNVFGSEVAELAICYMIALSRRVAFVDREVRAGHWPKPTGNTLEGKTIGIVGLGDIGQNLVRRLVPFGVSIIAYDPFFSGDAGWGNTILADFPDRVSELDYLVFTCALTESNRHMLSEDVVSKLRPGIRVVNVARGPLIDEHALLKGLEQEIIDSVALDVFEVEPLPLSSALRQYESSIFGSHNASNTSEAVHRVSQIAIDKMSELLNR